MQKYIHEFKEGDLVQAHGGVFKITHDAMESQAHRPDYWTSNKGRTTLPGPCDCAYAAAICIEGEVKGYFKPGSSWDFQGNFKGGKYTVFN
jgi:hypothetical protein